jgi:hypothetical protein
VIRGLNLLVAFLIEVAALVALSWWGFHIGSSTGVHVALGIAFPVVAGVLWGLFAAPRRPALPVPSWFDLVVKVLVFGTATAGLAATGHPVTAGVYAVIVMVNTAWIRLARFDAGIGNRP